MKPLRLIASPNGKSAAIDCTSIDPGLFQDASSEQIAQAELAVEGQLVRLDKLFAIMDGNRNHITIAPGNLKLDNVAAKLRNGCIEVLGSVANYASHSMFGGSLIVHGNAGDGLASGMRGGTVVVHGDAGEYVAGAVGLNKRGMRGGTVVVKGKCGRWLAKRMRRGLVIVGGPVEPGAATRMIAGTVVVSDHIEGPYGVGMKRGSIFQLAKMHIYDLAVPSGFTAAERNELAFLPLLCEELRGHIDDQQLSMFQTYKAWRSLGDRSQDGQGEIIWLNVCDKPKDESWF